MKRTSRIPAMLLLAGSVALSGCVSSTPAFDASYGESLRVLQAQQTAHPGAPVENAAKSPDGLDGQAARDAYERYQRSFRVPEPKPNVFTIGVSGGGGG